MAESMSRYHEKMQLASLYFCLSLFENKLVAYRRNSKITVNHTDNELFYNIFLLILYPLYSVLFSNRDFTLSQIGNSFGIIMYCGDETGAFVGDCGSSTSRFGYGGDDSPKVMFILHNLIF